VAVSRNGKFVVSGSEDDTVKLWDAARGRLKATFKGHVGEVTAVAISGDGKLVVSGSGDRAVKLWDPAQGKAKATLQGHPGKVTSVAISGEGKLLVSGGDQAVTLWEIAKTKKENK
jgi:WD40 repeat protein